MRVRSLLLAVTALAACDVQAQDAVVSETFVQQVALGPTEAASADRIYEQLWTEEQALLDHFLTDPAGRPGSFALIRQEGADLAAFIGQQGTRNVAVLLQDGGGLTTEVQQFGFGHLYGGRLVGTDAAVRVIQAGVQNTYLMDLEITNLPGATLDHDVIQEGLGLHLIQTGTTSTPFTVEQRGLDQTILIEHNGGR